MYDYEEEVTDTDIMVEMFKMREYLKTLSDVDLLNQFEQIDKEIVVEPKLNVDVFDLQHRLSTNTPLQPELRRSLESSFILFHTIVGFEP